MPRGDLEDLADTVEGIIDSLQAEKAANKQLLTEKKKMQERISSLEKQARRNQKEGDRIDELLAQNKAYKKKCALVKSRVASMLAKVEGMQ